MRISDMPFQTVVTGNESVPIYDPNGATLTLRNKRVLLSQVLGGVGPAGPAGASAYQVWLSAGNTGDQNAYLASLKGAQGNQGPQGATGAAGAAGSAGAAGINGTAWWAGNGAPSQGTGANNDFYLNLATGSGNGDVYVKALGTWGLQGNIKGPAGINADKTIQNIGTYFDNQASAIVAADANIVYYHVPFNGTLKGVIILGEGGVGSCQFDIWKAPLADHYPPVVADSIVDSHKPNISSGQSFMDTTLTGWTTTVTAGDVLAFKLESSTVFTELNIALQIQPT